MPRTTKEEFEFADFPIFDDPDQPYSLYNFSYTHSQFDRITQLMEFNTAINVETIKSEMANIIKHKREIAPRPPITLADVARLKLKFCNKDAASRLNAYVRSFSKKDKSWIRRATAGASDNTDNGNSNSAAAAASTSAGSSDT